MESATNQMLDTANRAIVDTNLDLTNIVDLTDEKSRKLVCESLDKCVKILEAHCGPHAGYAMLVPKELLPTGLDVSALFPLAGN